VLRRNNTQPAKPQPADDPGHAGRLLPDDGKS